MKKNLTYLFLLLLFGLFILSSCKKDEDSAEKLNQLLVNEKSYELTKGLIQYFGEVKQNTYNFDLYLFSNGINYDYTNNTYSGKGNIFYVELYSNSPTEILSGTYKYDPDATFAPFTFFSTQVALDFNVETGLGSEGGITGTIKVKKSGTFYEFTINGIAFENQKLTGYFKGDFEVIDSSSDIE